MCVYVCVCVCCCLAFPSRYRNPGAPVYIVQGTSGAVQREKFVNPVPSWSAFRLNGAYGYGIMEVTGAGLLEYRFVDLSGDVKDAWRIVKT